MLMFGTLTRLAAIQATIVNCWAHNCEANVRKGQEIQLNTKQFARAWGKCSRFVSGGQPFSVFSAMFCVSFSRETRDKIQRFPADFRQTNSKFGFDASAGLVCVLFFCSYFCCLLFFLRSSKVYVYKTRSNLEPRLQTSFIFECLALSEISCLRANSCCYFKFHFVVPRTRLHHQLYSGPTASAEIKFLNSPVLSHAL